jgi:hypothetical protein
VAEALAKAKLTDAADAEASNEDNEEEENEDKNSEDGDEDGNLDYTSTELRVVEGCVKLMKKSLASIKNTLEVATTVCDATHGAAAAAAAAATSSAGDTVFAPITEQAPGQPHTQAYTQAQTQEESRKRSQQWVAQLAQQSSAVYSKVLNLGAELYPPFEADTAAIEDTFAQLRGSCLELLQLARTGQCPSSEAAATAAEESFPHQHMSKEQAEKLQKLYAEIDPQVFSI